MYPRMYCLFILAKSIRIGTDFIRMKSYVDEKSTGEVQVIGMENLSSLEGEVIPTTAKLSLFSCKTTNHVRILFDIIECSSS